MADEPKVTVFSSGTRDEAPNGPLTVQVDNRGLRLLFRFHMDDRDGTGPVQEVRVLPGDEPLEPAALRRFAPDSELYLAYARAAIQIINPEIPDRRERLAAATASLRVVGGPGRGHPDAFFARIAELYRALVAGGEPHPIKAIGEIQHGTISAASRWVKEARQRGFLEPKEHER